MNRFLIEFFFPNIWYIFNGMNFFQPKLSVFFLIERNNVNSALTE